MFVMCENPNRIEAVHQPASSLLEALASKFCSNPRNKNSSGHAVKNRIPREVNTSELQRDHCGAKEMKCIPVPRGMAMQAKTTKLAMIQKPQLLPHPMMYPIPPRRRTRANAASAVPTATSTVKTYASRPPG